VRNFGVSLVVVVLNSGKKEKRGKESPGVFGGGRQKIIERN
jgi:hypothetical protein